MSLKHFIQITKPGIIFGNVLSVAGGFFLASKGNIDFGVFLAAVIGTSLVVASGCVFNNCIDRDIDQRMERTRNRVLVQGLVSLKLALLYATLLGIAGVALLYTEANPLAALFAVIGFVIYVASTACTSSADPFMARSSVACLGQCLRLSATAQ